MTEKTGTSISPFPFSRSLNGWLIDFAAMKVRTALALPSSLTRLVGFTISTLNSVPVANAGPDQVAFAGETVHLNGAGSTDVDGNPLTLRTERF